ncbi:MAG: hypothetical protein WCV91_05345, partial [Candidatus Margulisiibacteriota bacterium]
RDLFFAAKFLGVKALVICDHDTIFGLDEAKAASKLTGIETISGIEISTVHGDILGYGFDPLNRTLVEFLDGVRRANVVKLAVLFDLLKKHGYDLNTAEYLNSHPGNPLLPYSVAEYILEKYPGTKDMISLVRFINQVRLDSPAFQSIRGHKLGKPREAVEILHAAGGVAVWAHPYRTKAEKFELFLSSGIDGVEVEHGRAAPEDVVLMRSIATQLQEKNGRPILETGGDDFHAFPHPKKGLPQTRFCMGIEGNVNVPMSSFSALREATFGAPPASPSRLIPSGPLSHSIRTTSDPSSQVSDALQFVQSEFDRLTKSILRKVMQRQILPNVALALSLSDPAPQPGSSPNIAVLGGTFDFLHWGHILASLAAVDELNLDAVIFTPGGDMPNYPTYKPDKSPEAVRHQASESILSAFWPLLRYSRLGLEKPLAGNTDLAIELYLLNRAARPSIYYLSGADTHLGAVNCLLEYCQIIGVPPEEIPLKIAVTIRNDLPIQAKKVELPRNWEMIYLTYSDSKGISSSGIKRDPTKNFRLIPSPAWELLAKIGFFSTT